MIKAKWGTYCLVCNDESGETGISLELWDNENDKKVSFDWEDINDPIGDDTDIIMTHMVNGRSAFHYEDSGRVSRALAWFLGLFDSPTKG